jgi:excisionase family DNA binding protein
MDEMPLPPLDPRIEAAIAGWLDDDWPSEPDPPGYEVREAGTWEVRPAGAPAPLLVDIHEAARILGCGRSLVYEFIRRRQLPFVKLGRLTRFRVSALEEFVARRARDHRATKPWWEELDR